MSPSELAVLGFAAWTLLLVTTIGLMRSGYVLGGKRPANSFNPDGADVSAFSNRLCRAHANCYENLPIFLAVILLAIATGRSVVTDPLALWFLGARVAQSATHLASTSQSAVTLRFAFMLVQVGILAWWIIQLVRM